MAKVVPLKQALIFWIATIGSAFLLYYGAQLTDFLISDTHASTWVRWAGVFVGVFTILPWLVIIAVSLSVLDEYYRRVVLIGTALAFVLDLMLHVGFNVAVDAQLLRPGSYLPETGAAIILWMIGVSVGAIYYRFRL